MDVVLVNAPTELRNVEYEPGRSGSVGSYGLTNMPPLGLLYLASVLKGKGYEVTVVDCTARLNPLQSVSDVASMIASEKPKVVGISATSPQLRGAVRLADVVRAVCGEGTVLVLGGIHITADPSFSTRSQAFDVFFTGEGELTFPNLVEKALAGEKVKGLYYGERPQKLDALPFPAREAVNKADYFERGKEFANILTQRGCPFDCIHCDTPVVKGRALRFRSPVNVVDEMANIGDDYDWHYYLTDDLATVNESHMRGICTEILKRGLDVTWACQTRVDLVERKLLLLMYEAGCRYISFGVESGSPRIRNEVIGKRFSDESISKAFRMCREIGISTLCTLMLGLPTETLEDAEKTVELAKSIPADAVNISFTELYPSTHIFEVAVSQGLINWNYYEGNPQDPTPIQPAYYVPPGVSFKQLSSLRHSVLRKTQFHASATGPV